MSNMFVKVQKNNEQQTVTNNNKFNTTKLMQFNQLPGLINNSTHCFSGFHEFDTALH